MQSKADHQIEVRMESYQIKLKESFASVLTKINALVSLRVRVGLIPLIGMTVLCRIILLWSRMS